MLAWHFLAGQDPGCTAAEAYTTTLEVDTGLTCKYWKTENLDAFDSKEELMTLSKNLAFAAWLPARSVKLRLCMPSHSSRMGNP